MMLKTNAYKKIKSLTKRIRVIAGGTSAGKTEGILMWLLVLAQHDTKPTLTSIVSESFPHLSRGAMRDFLGILEAQNDFYDDQWDKTNHIYTLSNGSKIEFFSADQAGKVRGPRRDRLFINEGNNISYETADQLIIRTSEFVFIDFNPTSEFWFYTEMLGKRNDIDFITVTYKDNQALVESIVREIELHRGNKHWWTVYGEGKLGEMGDKIYKDWKLIDEIPHEARLVKYGLDFGYTHDPAALVAVYYLNGGYIVDEILFQKGLSNKQIADTLLALPQAVTIADSAEPKSIDELRLYGLSVLPTTKGKGSVAQRIAYTQSQRISVTKRSVNVIKEYRNYMWETDKNGKQTGDPEHTFSHSMDAISYAIQSMRPVQKARRRVEQGVYETPSIAQPERRVAFVERNVHSLHRAQPYETSGL